MPCTLADPTSTHTTASAMPALREGQPLLILDTNIVLDLLLFKDPQAVQFQERLQLARWQWIATEAMRDELAHVLRYEHLQERLTFYANTPEAILAAFDAHVALVPVAPSVPVRCRDQDDQKFIDLAVAHQATLLSKDKQVLKLARRLAKLEAHVFSPIAQLHLL